MTLIKVDPKEYKIESTRAKQIAETFKPMLEQMESLEKEYNEVIKLPMNPETYQKARELRLKYVKTRTGTAAIHKELKAFYLQAGKFIDGWKNAQAFAADDHEEKLMAIEKYEENLEKERIRKLTEERLAIVRKYDPDFNIENIGEYSELFWSRFLKGMQQAHAEKIEAEKLAEQQRIEEERIQKLHDQRNQILKVYWHLMDEKELNLNYGSMSKDEFEELKAKLLKQQIEATERDRKLKLKNERIELIRDLWYLNKEKQIDLGEMTEKQFNELHKKLKGLKAEELKQIEIQNKEREAARKQLEEQKRIADETQAKLDEMRRQVEEEERLKAEAKEAELKKNDGDKLNDLMKDLTALKTKYKFESETNQHIFADVIVLIDKINLHIKSKLKVDEDPKLF